MFEVVITITVTLLLLGIIFLLGALAAMGRRIQEHLQWHLDAGKDYIIKPDSGTKKD